MKTLYIFPHPDDESFGPAPVIYRQIQNGEEVHLLTLTKGGATKMRFKYDLSIEEMGEVRLKEMEKVKEVLQLSSMEVLDLEDGGMARLNPLEIERIVLDRINNIQPDVVVTYPIHGISGHHDHLTIHAVLKNLFCKVKNDSKYSFWKRLAFFTLPKPDGLEKAGATVAVNTTHKDHIDCVVKLTEKEQAILRESLYCYETFIDVIIETGVIEGIGDRVHFEFFGEIHNPKLDMLTKNLPS